LSSMCDGALLDRAKRALIVGDPDRSFYLSDDHGRIDIKYKDPADKAKGGQLRLVVHDMEYYLPNSMIGKVDILFKFDAGVSTTDGLFDLDIDYYLEGPVGVGGVEQGTLKMFHHKKGNNWVSHLETGRDRINVVTTFSDSHFRLDVDGMNRHGQQIRGTVDGKKVSQGYRTKIDLSKGNKKLLQIDSKVKADGVKMEYSTKTVYSILGGKVCTIMMKYENQELAFSHINKASKEKIDIKFTASNLNLLRPDGNFRVDVEGTFHGEQIKGRVENRNVNQGYWTEIDLSKGKKKLLQIFSKMKADEVKMEYATKTVHRMGVTQGAVMMKYENQELAFSHMNKATQERIELRALLNHEDNFRIYISGAGVKLTIDSTKYPIIEIKTSLGEDILIYSDDADSSEESTEESTEASTEDSSEDSSEESTEDSSEESISYGIVNCPKEMIWNKFIAKCEYVD